jgi:hypothetical protein
MCDTVEWRHGRDKKFGRATDAELASIRRLASAARDHRRCMAAIRSDDTGLREILRQVGSGEN